MRERQRQKDTEREEEKSAERGREREGEGGIGKSWTFLNWNHEVKRRRKPSYVYRYTNIHTK